MEAEFDHDPLTSENDFEARSHSQDEADMKIPDSNPKRRAGCDKHCMGNSQQLLQSRDYCTLEDIKEKYPGCFSVDYPAKVFDGVGNDGSYHGFPAAQQSGKTKSHRFPASSENCNSVSKDTGQPCQALSSQGDPQGIPYIHHPGPVLYNTVGKVCGAPVLSVHHRKQSISCVKDEMNADFGTQSDSLDDTDFSSDRTYGSNKSENCPNLFKNASSLSNNATQYPRELSKGATERSVSPASSARIGKPASWEELFCQSKSLKFLNKVLKRRRMKEKSPYKKISSENSSHTGVKCTEKVGKDKCLRKTPPKNKSLHQTSLSSNKKLQFSGLQSEFQKTPKCKQNLPSFETVMLPEPKKRPLLLPKHTSHSSDLKSRQEATFSESDTNENPKMTSYKYFCVTSNNALLHESSERADTTISPVTSTSISTSAFTSHKWLSKGQTTSQHTWRTASRLSPERPQKSSGSLSDIASTSGSLRRRSDSQSITNFNWRKSSRQSLDQLQDNTASLKSFSSLSPQKLSWEKHKRRSLDSLQDTRHLCYKADFDEEELHLMTFEPGFIDTHCHLDFLFDRIKHKGSFESFQLSTKDPFPVSFEGCVTIFCKPWTFENVRWWHNMLDDPRVWGAFGVHPHFVDDFGIIAEGYLRAALDHPKCVALGEIGLDYFKGSGQQFLVQRTVLRSQLKTAIRFKKPVIIHCRDAHEDCIKAVKEILPRDHYIHVHCFTGTWKEAREWLETFSNLYLGITNLINNHRDIRCYELQNAVKSIPLKRLLLETDAPFFRPYWLQHTGGQHSHPGMAIYVAGQIACLKGEKLQVVLSQVRQNTRDMYGI